MFEDRGIFCPTFQPYLSASCLPAIMAVRVPANAFHCSSGMTHSGYTSWYRCGSRAKVKTWVFSCQTPPNHCEYATRATPGTDSSLGTMLRGNACVKETRAWVISRVAPIKSAPELKIELSDCNNPNNKNAM